jgi:hypothetical protein
MTTTPPPQPHDWLMPEEPAATTETPESQPATRSRRAGAASAAALIAAGVLAGGGVGLAVGHHSTSASTAAPTSAALPGQPGQPRPGGGLDGEQHVQGIVRAVGSSSLTITSASGASTYAVTASTQIVRNGVPAALSSLKPGEQVFAHVYPSGGGLAVERVLVGAPPRLHDDGGSGDGTDT